MRIAKVSQRTKYTELKANCHTVNNPYRNKIRRFGFKYILLLQHYHSASTGSNKYSHFQSFMSYLSPLMAEEIISELVVRELNRT
jgi:hypothetical protein